MVYVVPCQRFSSLFFSITWPLARTFSLFVVKAGDDVIRNLCPPPLTQTPNHPHPYTLTSIKNTDIHRNTNTHVRKYVFLYLSLCLSVSLSLCLSLLILSLFLSFSLILYLAISPHSPGQHVGKKVNVKKITNEPLISAAALRVPGTNACLEYTQVR